MFRARFPLILTFAFSLLLALTSNTAHAQYSPASKHPLYRYGYDPGYYASTALRIPPASKGFQATRMIEQHYRVTERAAAASASQPVTREQPAATEPTSDLAVAIKPPPSKPMTVSIRGPDGVVRTFPLASPEAIQPRTIIVRPGEKLTIGINGSIRVQLQRK